MSEGRKTSLSPAAEGFLVQQGFAGHPRRPLPGDASARRYTRIADAGLLMEDPSDPVGFAAFVKLSAHLNAIGLSTPHVSGLDTPQGLALIEDFGTATYGQVLKNGTEDEADLYRLAIETLVHLHSHPRATHIDVPGYDLEVLLEELSIFSTWFVPMLRPDLDVDAFDQRFRALWKQALQPLKTAPPTLVLRDFHIDNLMVLDGRPGIARCGVLDFQDALRGPAEYDLVSLLQDARRDLAPGLEREMLALYLSQAPAYLGDAEAITQRYHLLGAQRHTRIAGLFLRLDQRDGKPGYLPFLPRVIAQMETALADAGLDAIADFIDTALPGWRDAGQRLAQRDGR